MFNIKKLNKKKTYIGWQVGKGIISGLIQLLSLKEVKQFKLKLQRNEIATHIFILININGVWYVIEFHKKWEGIKKLPFDEWVKDYDPERIFCAECDMDMNNVNYLLAFNPGYSLCQISLDALKEIIDKKGADGADHFLWYDSPGQVCSEGGANMMKDHAICLKFNIPAYLIKPVHYQIMFIDKVIS